MEPVEEYIQCPKCLKKSYNKNDIANNYCGNCKKFYEEYTYLNIYELVDPPQAFIDCLTEPDCLSYHDDDDHAPGVYLLMDVVEDIESDTRGLASVEVLLYLDKIRDRARELECDYILIRKLA